MKKIFKKVASVVLTSVLALSAAFATADLNTANAAYIYRVNEKSIMQKTAGKLAERTENNVLEGAMPCRGNANILIVNMTFIGVNTTLTTADIENMAFGKFTRNNSVYDENITEYFSKISYDKLKVSGNVVEYKLDKAPASKTEYNTYCIQALNSILAKENVANYDANNDGYLDGVIFICPSSKLAMYGSYTDSWEYTYGDYKVCNRANLFELTTDSCASMEHEMIHLMGLPDIHSNIGLNSSGTHADTLMDGNSSMWMYSTGAVSNDIPGVMKFFFGWIDNLIEVRDAFKSYSLYSYATTSEAMVLYPKADPDSKFIFFVEYVTPEGSCSILKDNTYIGEGGLRIWAVNLNVDDYGNIIGNDKAKGCGNSPFTYIEALNKDGDKFVLNAGVNLTSDTTPSSNYYTEFNIQGSTNTPLNSLDSGISVTNYRVSSGKAYFSVAIDNQVNTYGTSTQSFEYIESAYNTITITKYTGSDTVVTVPETIDGKPVTTLGLQAFYNCTEVTSITLPSTLTTIGDSAFNRCLALTEIVIPDGVKALPKSVFSNCQFLAKVTLPSKLKVVGPSAFYNCYALADVTLPDTVVSICEQAFFMCKNLVELNIPEGIETIENSAFTACYALKKVKLPSTIKSIEYMAFYSCSKLEEVNIPEGVTSIDDKAFMGCYSLTQLKLPKSLKTFNLGAVCNNSGLDYIFIPNNVTELTVATELNISDFKVYCLKDSPALATFEGLSDDVVLDYTYNVTQYGDANGDNDVNVSDGVIFKKYLAGIDNLDIVLEMCDVTADGDINVSDAVKLMKYLAGYNEVLGAK